MLLEPIGRILFVCSVLKHTATHSQQFYAETNLHFVAHMPNSVFGDQLVAQLFRLIPERGWLFKHGRVPLSMIISEALHQVRTLASSFTYVNSTYHPKRTVAPAGSRFRSKVGVIAEAVSEVEDALSRSQLAPFNDHFHPLPPSGVARKSRGHIMGGPVAAVNLYPLKQSVSAH